MTTPNIPADTTALTAALASAGLALRARDAGLAEQSAAVPATPVPASADERGPCRPCGSSGGYTWERASSGDYVRVPCCAPAAVAVETEQADDEWPELDEDYRPPCGDDECRQMHCGRCNEHSGSMGHYSSVCHRLGGLNGPTVPHHQCCPGNCEMAGTDAAPVVVVETEPDWANPFTPKGVQVYCDPDDGLWFARCAAEGWESASCITSEEAETLRLRHIEQHAAPVVVEPVDVQQGGA